MRIKSKEVHQNLLLFSSLDMYKFTKNFNKKNYCLIQVNIFGPKLHVCFIECCCKSNKLLQKKFQRIIYCLYDDLYEQGHHFSYSFEASRTFGQGPSDTRGKMGHGPPKILVAT